MAGRTEKLASGGLAARLRLYQRERFPLAAYAPLVIAFTFSAAAYSRLARGEAGFVPLPLFAAGALTAVVFFFWLRILDEHKDAVTDRRYRPELPVPRGLVTLAELRAVGTAALALALAANLLLAPRLLWALLPVALFTALMTREFFVGEWLRARPTAYLVSHMLVMPLIDGYTTGLDWLAEGVRPSPGLWFFLAVTFLNGSLVEIGRKLRAPEDEREGVATYTADWGPRAGPVVWLGTLAAALALAWLAARYTGAGAGTAALLLVLAALATVPAVRFLRGNERRWARRCEVASGLWVIAVYLILGAGPLVVQRAFPG